MSKHRPTLKSQGQFHFRVSAICPHLITNTMQLTTILVAALGSIAAAADLGIEVTKSVECDRKTVKGDGVSMHYRGTLQSDGSEFDSSYKRHAPLTFKLGTGRVIKG